MANYWTMFYYGGVETICSKHRTHSAAIAAVRHCESRGGSRHRIVKVMPVSRKLSKPKRKPKV